MPHGKNDPSSPPGSAEKAAARGKKLSQTCGETVTVSDLIRSWIGEKLPQVCTKVRSERSGIFELRDQLAVLREENARLQEEVENLVRTLSQIFPLLATSKQIDSLTEGIEWVIKAVSKG